MKHKKEALGKVLTDDGLEFIKDKFDKYEVRLIKLSEGRNTGFGTLVNFIPRIGHFVSEKDGQYYIYNLTSDIVIHLVPNPE